MESPTITEDIAVIKNEIKNLSKSFEDYKKDNKMFCTEITRQSNTTENQSLRNAERISNMNIFQASLSLIVGAVATYLGVNK